MGFGRNVALARHQYHARSFAAPVALPAGTATIDLAQLMWCIVRGQDPNLPGFSAATRIPGYAKWPMYRYGPLLSRRKRITGLGVVDRLDPRKKGIVAEDIALGFAVDAMDRLGASGCITKWEIAQSSRRASLRALLISSGVTSRAAAAVVAGLMRGIKGADLVGYSPRLGSWIVCEAKGTVGEPTKPADIQRVMGNPAGPALGKSGQPVLTVPPYHRAVQQKAGTAQALRGLPNSSVLGLAVLTSLGTIGNRRRTTVDYVDPVPPEELEPAIEMAGPALRALIAEAHYDWIARLLDLDRRLWGEHRDPDHLGLVSEVAIPLDEGRLVLSFSLDPEIVPALSAASVDGLDAYAEAHEGHPTGLLARVIEAPEVGG